MDFYLSLRRVIKPKNSYLIECSYITLPNLEVIVLAVDINVLLKYSKIEDPKKYSILHSIKQRYMFYFYDEKMSYKRSPTGVKYT